MPKITIDGIELEIEAGSTVLDAVRKLGLDLPTLCHLEGLPAYGACRLCMVQLQSPVQTVVASCSYPVEEGLVVDTQGAEAVAARRMMLEFLLGRCPTSGVIQALAQRAGLEKSRFVTGYHGQENAPGSELCILCGLCVRVCTDMVGAAAIGFYGRGEHRQVGAPFFLQSEACIGCGACAYVCPTGAMKIEEKGGRVYLHTWNTSVPLGACPSCGKAFTPEPMSFLLNIPAAGREQWGQCPECRRKNSASQTALAMRQ